MKKRIFVLAAAMSLILLSCEKVKPVVDVIDFEEITLESRGYWNGDDASGGFSSGNATFTNRYDNDWEVWSGFAVSNHTDVITPDVENQYSSIAGSGASESAQYAVYNYFMDRADTIWFEIPEKITAISVSNTTYAYMAMLNGNAFAKKFGGDSGSDPDWFKVVLTALNNEGNPVGSVDIFLADYRYDNNSLDYISNVWTKIDLSVFGFVKGLVIEIASSDTGEFGINTPAYVCIDDIRGTLNMPLE